MYPKPDTCLELFKLYFSSGPVDNIWISKASAVGGACAHALTCRLDAWEAWCHRGDDDPLALMWV